MNVLEAVSDIQQKAKSLRLEHPDIATALSLDAMAVLGVVPACPVSDVAALFGVSRDTAYSWIKKSYLRAVEREGQLLVDPASVTALIPVIDSWREGGSVGRPGTAIRQWLADEAKLRARSAVRDIPHRHRLADWLAQQEGREADGETAPGRSSAAAKARRGVGRVAQRAEAVDRQV